MRTQFAFYKSFDDVYQDLNNKQKLEFMDTILDVQFLRIKIEDVKFEDIILKHIWNAQKHSISKSINGYLESQKNTKIKEPFLGVYDESFIPSQTPSEGVHKEEKGEGEGEEKEQIEVKEFSFSLSTIKQLSSTTKEYQERLKAYIEENQKGMSYQDFFDSCEMKGYKYKNYKLVYDKWNKDKYTSNDRKLVNHNIKGAEGYTIS